MGELDTEFLGDERRCDADRLGIDAIQRTDEGATNNRNDLKRVSGPSSISRVTFTALVEADDSIMLRLHSSASPGSRE